MTVAVIDHGAAALTRLRQYLKGKPNVAAILNVATAQAQELEVALQDLLLLRALAVATGDALAQIGLIVGQARDGDTDADYRVRIGAGIKLNRSSGLIDEVVSILALLTPAGVTVTLIDEWDAGFRVVLMNAVNATRQAILLRFLQRLRAAGVRGLLQWGEAAAADTFTLDGTAAQALDVGKFQTWAV